MMKWVVVEIAEVAGEMELDGGGFEDVGAETPGV